MGRKILDWIKQHGRTLSSVFIILVGTGIFLYLEGRQFICQCGYVELWHGEVNNSGNSQHLFDPYSLSHILHGFAFYLILWKFAGKLSPKHRFILALLIEAGWEILENSNFIINRYRHATVAYDYFGDSMVNSLGDMISMGLGFWLAQRLKLIHSLILCLILEITLFLWIRDNLTLNVIMLVYPVETIKQWQVTKGWLAP